MEFINRIVRPDTLENGGRYLSLDAPGAGSHHFAQSCPALLPAGGGLGAGQHLGLLALGVRPFDRPRASSGGPQALPFSSLHPLADTRSGGPLWLGHVYPNSCFT